MTLGHLGHLGYIYETLGTNETHGTLGIYMRHLRHYKLQMLYICKNINVIYFLVKCSISKVSTVHNVGSKLDNSLRRINCWHTIKRNNFKVFLFQVIYSKPFD